MAKWDNPIGIPFAESGDRTAIPDTSENGDVNNTTGFGNKYEIDPAVGGLWLYRQTMNSLFHSMFSSIKEIQTKVPISVNGTAPDVSGNISIPIPVADGAGIKVIDDNNTDITSFNQITENGIYYIYKKLTGNPYEELLEGLTACINLIVINVKSADTYNIDYTIQLISLNLDGYLMYPSNIGVYPKLRYYNKTDSEWSVWYNRYGIIFSKNNIVLDEFTTANKSGIRFPIIARDDSDPNSVGFNDFMYSVTKEQMREQLGITDQPDLTNYFNKKTDKLDLATQVENILGKENGGLGMALTNSDARGIFWVNLGLTETDVNSMIKSGFYQCFNWKNYPIGASHANQGALWNFNWNDYRDGNSSGWGYQLYITAIGEIWRRYRNNSNFSSWKRMLSDTGIVTTDAGGTGNTLGVLGNISKQAIYPSNIELTPKSATVNNGGAIDFHYNQSAADYTSRIIENASGRLSITAQNGLYLNGKELATNPLVYTNDVGTWTETKLSDGTTMLEGYGKASISPKSFVNIVVPKTISLSDIINLNVQKEDASSLSSQYDINIDFSLFNNAIRLSRTSEGSQVNIYFWGFKAILD